MHTMIVKAAPLFATILWRWLGYNFYISYLDQISWSFERTRFAIPIGDALSEVGGAIVDVLGVASDVCIENQL